MAKLVRVMMIVCLLTFVASGLFSADEKQYIAIIDAGSSGSRLCLYNIDSSQGCIKAVGKYSAKVKGGLAACANSDDVKKHFDKIIESFRSWEGRPSDCKEENTPIFLRATAGMRVLAPQSQELIYDLVRNYFKRNTKFANIEKDFKSLAVTIPGETEALFDWAAINSSLERFKSDSKTVGVIDMGGASMQVAYPVDSANEGGLIKTVKIGDFKYTVHCRSYLGLGSDFLRYQYSDNGDCFFPGFPMPDADKATGKFTDGYNAIYNVLKGTQRIDAIPANTLSNTEFYAMSTFKSIASKPDFYNRSDKDSFPITIGEMKRKAQGIATNNWNIMSKRKDFEGNSDMYVFSLLFASEYITAALDLLGFSDQAPITVTPVSWTEGAAIYLAYNSPETQTNAEEDTTTNLMYVQQQEWDNSDISIE